MSKAVSIDAFVRGLMGSLDDIDTVSRTEEDRFMVTLDVRDESGDTQQQAFSIIVEDVTDYEGWNS